MVLLVLPESIRHLVKARLLSAYIAHVTISDLIGDLWKVLGGGVRCRRLCDFFLLYNNRMCWYNHKSCPTKNVSIRLCISTGFAL